MRTNHSLLLGSSLLVTALAAIAACSGTTAGGGSPDGGNNSDGTASSSGGSSGSSSGSSGGDSGSDPFVGSWDCTGTESLTFTKPAGAKPETEDYATAVTIVAGSGDTETVTDTAEDGGGIPCTVTATVSGSTATIASGQSCQRADGTTVVYTAGTATLTSSTTFSVSRAFTFSGTVTVTPDGGSPEQVQVVGSGTSAGTCTKQ